MRLLPDTELPGKTGTIGEIPERKFKVCCVVYRICTGGRPESCVPCHS